MIARGLLGLGIKVYIHLGAARAFFSSPARLSKSSAERAPLSPDQLIEQIAVDPIVLLFPANHTSLSRKGLSYGSRTQNSLQAPIPGDHPMNYPTAVSKTWRHLPLDNAAFDYTPLVRYATLAASSHNTQPWKFRLQPGRIDILPDLSQRCAAVDPDDHHLYASLGCAAENLLLAAQAAGLQAHCAFNATESCVEVILGEGKSANLAPTLENANDPAPSVASQLFDAIPRRQCSRVPFDGTPLTEDERRLLEQAGRGDGVSLLLLIDAGVKEQIAAFVAKGNSVQFADAAWVLELKSWVRFNARDAIRTGDGLYGPVMGSLRCAALAGPAVHALRVLGRAPESEGQPQHPQRCGHRRALFRGRRQGALG